MMDERIIPAEMAHIRHLSQAFRAPQSAQPLESPKNGRKPAMPLVTLLLLAFGFFVLLSASFKTLSKGSSVIPDHRRSKGAHIVGGLLHDDLNGYRPCHSRMQQHVYRKASAFIPSSYLISKLRRYEALHMKCAPEAENFIKVLKSPELLQKSDCRFIVWIDYSGLGNRLMSLAGTFLYALLTERVLLVDRGTDMSDLFCEPFPHSSWLLPVGLPQAWLQGLDKSSPHRFGRLIDKGECSVHVNLSSVPAYSYVHLTHSFDIQDRRFFCDEEQKVLNQIPLLFLRSNLYFVPSLYFVPALAQEIEKLFPEREALFHHLARYLFHPSNEVWGRIVRFYDAYLGNAEEVVGIQIRTFDLTKMPSENVTSQVFACTIGNKILPNASNLNQDERSWSVQSVVMQKKPISVLVTSLHQEHFERIREFYLSHSTEQGRLVRVQLPSHEEEQKTGKAEHDKQALTDIFLLSLSDTLVTSPMSTFGYAAQGLAGVRPWVLTRPGEQTYQQYACIKALSLEPCFHAPPLFDCDCQGGRDPGKVLKFVRHCEDVNWGLKLFEDAPLPIRDTFF